ncbi:hypothetical protein L218DRAFT_859912 [Marasmius fiardii PR-910]|nr:hypothetical protein L218DRAFT_859912 [Marasmius fiardii PR-910]
MRFSTTLVTLLPVAGALAAVQTVTVGDGSKLLFDPPSVTAAVGDTIKFEFKSKNHSVTQSTFDAPCVFKANGVDSGFQLTPPNATSFASWSFEVQATDPTWWFCAQTAPAVHCTAGMVFAVNPTADKTFDMFKVSLDQRLVEPGDLIYTSCRLQQWAVGVLRLLEAVLQPIPPALVQQLRLEQPEHLTDLERPERLVQLEQLGALVQGLQLQLAQALQQLNLVRRRRHPMRDLS